jgi:hypothetical protein
VTERLTQKTQAGKKVFKRLEALLALAAAAALLIGWWGYSRYYERRIGPEQPIPFSHRVHAGDKQIGCLVCHYTAPVSDRAGIPPLETCLLCHRREAIHFQPIENLRNHYFSNRPVEWVRVHWVPEFVYFTHRVHLARGIDCSQCHGDVKAMDRIVRARKFEMGFCIGCHRKNSATHDCFTCHR